MAGDKTYITDGQGKQHRATRVHAVTPTDIVWSSNPNDYTVQVKINGEWHRAVLTMDAGAATFFENINIDKGLIVGSDGKSHTALIVKPESTVTLSSIKTDEHALVSGTTTGETAVVTYEENWSNVKYQDNVNVYKVLVTGSDSKVHTALLTTSSGGSVEVIVVGPAPAPLSLPNAIANSLDYVKAYGGTEQRNVPEGYTELEYLVADGASYITTNYIPTPDSVVKTKIYATGTGAVFGSRWTPSPTYDTFGFIRTSSNFLAYYGRYSDGYYKSISANVDTLYDFVFDINSVKLGNTTTSITRGQFTATEPLCIGALNNVGTAGSFFTGRLYRLTISENGVVKADFIPCSRTADSVLGMYETVSGTFLTNDGTGTFTAGSTVSVSPSTPVSLVCNNGTLKTRHTSGLPLEYEEVEYLESSGGQYLDTGVILKGETLEVDCDFAFATVPDVDSVPRVIWGFMGPNALPRAALFGYQGKFSYGSNNTSSLAIFIDTNKHSSVFYASVNGSSCSFMFDGYGYTGSGSPQSYTANDLSIYLFARNNDSTGVGNWSVSRIYSGMKFKLDNVVVRDYITCRRLSDNVLGMYDLVNKTFITNLGTGTFTAGNTVADPTEVYVDGTTETIYAGGKNLFDAVTAGQIGSGYLSINWTVGADGLNTISGTSTGAGGRNSNKTGTFTLGAGTYTVSFSGTKDINLVLVNETTNTDIVSGLTGGTFTLTEPTPLHFGISATNNTTYDSSFYTQIEYGSAATSYAPYSGAGTTATCEDLLSIGDYTDVQEVITGDVTRKVGVKVLDGTEIWNYYSVTQGALFRTQIADTVSDGKDILGVLCNAYQVTSVGNRASGTLSGTATNYDFLNDNYTTLDDWKAYLAAQYAAGTPVIIVYPLATPTTESVAGQALNVTEGDNVVDITQASLSDLELEAQYTKSV